MKLPFLEKTDGSASFLRAARAGNLEKVLEFLKTNTDINTCNANGLNALHLASKEGHVNVVRELLQRGANVDAATKKGNTALHIASLAGQEEIVKVLVQHQALVNIQSQNGFTPLYMAAQENHDSVVRFLLANSANQSLATEDGFTPLAVALQQGHDKVVAVLLENDTRGKVRLPALHIAAKKDDTKAAALLLHTDHNPDVTSKSGFTPLHIAAHYGNENIANLLIQRGADVNYIAKHQITPLHVASKWGKGNMVSLLIDKGANYEAKTRDGLTPLHCAARSGHETVVDMLLEKGAPITSKTKNGLAPLHMASQGDHVDAARILLYHKAPVDDVTVDYLTALHVAAHCGHVRVAKLLLDRKADPNARALNGFTPLHIACKKNRIKVVELLLKHGASIEATTESGLTPLHVASFMGCMNIVIYLIQHGASADVPTVRGETPLHLAARANQTDIIRILLRNGAHVDARAREQQTALHIASRLGNSDIVVLLLQHGAAVDATTKDHYTALHIAAKEGQEEVASVLLEHGASLTSTTKKGFTPLHLAAKYGNMKVARLLLQKDAPVDAQGKNGVTPLHVAAHYDHQNVALLLLDKGASPHATAKNGYTPLHIAARKNQMDIATTLLEYGASANAESKAGFTPLHLSSQEGHTDMATLLIEHNAAAGACAKNGLTPLHLCAQEDRVNVAAILVKHGAQIDPSTKAGYTPLHVACHFGQMNMVRFLLQHGAKVDSTTQLGYTPLHQAAQQGHTQIVNLLLENKAEPNTETNDGKTALSIAQRLGYISVVETLKIVTETTINTTTTTVTEEKYKVVVPETMHETFMSESEDEGGDDTMLGDQSYRYLTVDEMKSLGDDSLPIDVTKDEKMDVSFISNSMAAPPVAPADQLSPQHLKEQQYVQFTAHYPSDNVDVAKTPILAGPESLNTTLNTTIDSAMIESQIEPQIIQSKLAPQLSAQKNQESLQPIPLKQIPVQNKQDQASHGQVTSVTEKAAEILNGWEGFLVSFMVDARGGAMRGCRHSGVRVIIPPRKAAMPMRVTCRYLKKDKLVHAPPLMEGEALASRILEMGPAGAKFLGPVIIEVPHFASLRGKEREIVILRSDNGETWREHTLEATEEAVQEVLNESFDGEELKQLEDLNTNRITRILTTDFPQYFAIVTRIRQEVHAIGPEGGMVSSTVVPQVQAVFPQGALTKKIKVGLQAQPIPTDLVAKLLGNRVAVSPIVTVEPRRRKFHKPITLTIPVPQASSKGMINQYSGEAPTLRLLCSITGGTTRAQWEDVTGSTPLTHVNDCVSFTTTVSARFWLMDCSNIPEATKMATELYREAIHVPFMAKFVVFSKRHQLEEARVRVFCMTDDREDKTLEQQELFVEVAKSRDVEVLEGKPQFLEFAGNLVPVTKSGDQLAFNFYAFRENRLPFTVRVKDQHADPIGRVAFMRQPKVGRGDPPQTPICNLNIALPDNIQPEPAPSEPDLLALEKKYSFLSISKADTIHKADLRLTDISNMLGTDWVALAHELEISDSDINIIKSQYPDNAPQQAIVMLRLWMQTSGNKANGNTLEKGLRKIGRDDIVNQCIFNVELVTDDIERAMAKAHLDQSGFEAFRDELGPSRDTTLNRDVSLDVSYDEQDMMKEAESAEEEEENQRAYQDKSSREERTVDMSPTYESEEKKYAGEEKVVTEEKVPREKAKDGSPVTISTTPAAVKKEPSEGTKLDEFIKEKTVVEPFQEIKVESIIKENLAQESHKDIKMEPFVTEYVVSEPIEETIRMKKEVVPKAEQQTLLEKSEKTFTVAEAEEKELEKEDEQLMEQSELEKTVVKVVEKPTEILEEEIKMKESEAPEVIHTSQLDEPQKIHAKTVTEIVSRPEGTLMAVTTTEKKSYTTSEDGTIEEHIVVQKQTSRAVDGMEMGEEKSVILQKIGEELGRLDEKLEEKFKEKRKTDEPEVAQEEVREEAVVAKRREDQVHPTSQVVVECSSLPTTLCATTTITTATSSITPIPDVFTQTSVESTQMSSARGTAEVSCPGTSVTTGDEALMQLEQALIQQAAPQLVDRRIAHHDPQQQEVSLHQCSHQEQPQGKNAATEEDLPKSGRTEERGCSPITVLEARHELDQVTLQPLSKGSSHTITTTTSWGAPVLSTTSIQFSDSESAHCVQFTLHSESCVTLHAPGEIWQELGHAKQQQQQEQDTHQMKFSGEENDKADATKRAITLESEQQSNEDIFRPHQGIPLKSLDFKDKKSCDESERRDIANDVSDIQHVPIYPECDENVTSTEASSDSRHESQDPSNRGYTEVKGMIDQTNVELVNSVQRHIPREKDIASVDPLAEESMSEFVDISGKEAVDKAVISVLSEDEAEEIMLASSRDLERTVCEIPAALSEDPVYVATEVIAPSTHRPTTLMITSNSNESTDDAECTANDPTRDDRESDIPQELKQEGGTAVMEEREQHGVGIAQSVVLSDHLSGSESGAVPRVERPMRPAPRTTTLVKVKVEKRPVGNHPPIRERIVHEHQAVVHAPSVEEEVRGLMQEVKEATSQIKQEVKELRQADTPTPDTPTPLREFKEFLNREEEQEQERLPTIKEMCRENEEDASISMGGEHMHGNEHLHLRLNVPVQECSTPLQVVQPGFDYSIHPDSGYSTLEGYNAVSVNPSQTATYIPFFTEMVPEGFSNELSDKSELESPLSPVVSSNFCPVDNVGSTISQDSEKHSRSKFKSLLTKVYKLTSKGLHKSESRKGDGQGENLADRNSVRDIADIDRCKLASWETSGIVINKDKGMQSPSYEFKVQKNAAKQKSIEYQEKHSQRNGNEFYTDISEELIKTPIKIIKDSHTEDTHTAKVEPQSPVSELSVSITLSHLLEMPLTETPHTDSSSLEQSLNDILNTEPIVTESADTKYSELKVIDTLSSAPSSTDMPLTVSPVSESQGEHEFFEIEKMTDKEMFSSSSFAVDLGMPGKTVIGHASVVCKNFENHSPTNELPVIDSVADESATTEVKESTIGPEDLQIPKSSKLKLSTPENQGTQSLRKSQLSESFITGSYIIETKTESKADNIQETVISKIGETDESDKSKLKLTPLEPYFSSKVAASDMGVGSDCKLSVKANFAHLKEPHDGDKSVEKKWQPPFTEQDLNKVSLADIKPSLEKYEDDYIEIHHTDGVEVLETLIELDETEESDDLSLEEQERHVEGSEEIKQAEERQLREEYHTESKNGLRIEVIKTGEPDLESRRMHIVSNSSSHNNEVQSLSEAKVETVTEGINLLEELTGYVPMFSDDELPTIPGKSEAIKTDVIEEVDTKTVVIPKGRGITEEFHGSEKTNVSLNEMEKALYQSCIPKTGNKIYELGDDNEIDEVGYVSSCKTVHKEIDVVKIEGMPSPEEGLVKDTGVSEVEKPRDFDTAVMTHEMSSPTYVKNWLDKTIHVNEPHGEGLLPSTATHSQMEKQSDIIGTADAEGKINEEMITSHVSLERGNNSPQNKLRIDIETGKKIKAIHHTSSDYFEEGMVSEPKEIKASGLESDPESNVITNSCVNIIKEHENVTSADGKQFISEENVKTVTENVCFFEKLLPRSKDSTVTEPVGLYGKAEATETAVIEELNKKDLVIPEGIGITDFHESGESKVELNEMDNISYQTYLPKVGNNTDEIKENSEADETGIISSHKIVDEDKVIEIIKTQEGQEPEGILVEDTRVTYKINEPRDFDAAEMTQNVSRHTDIVAQQSEGTVLVNKPDQESSSSSMVGQKYTEEQLGVLEMSPADGKMEGGLLKFSQMTERVIISTESEKETERILPVLPVGEEDKCVLNKLEGIEKTDKNIRTLQQIDSYYLKCRESGSEPEFEVSRTDFHKKNVISIIPQVNEVEEFENVALPDEMQYLSASVKAGTEQVSFGENLRHEFQLLSEAEFSVDESVGIYGKPESTEAVVHEDMDKNDTLVLKVIGITGVDESEETNAELHVVENPSYVSSVPIPVNETIELGDSDEIGRTGHITSYKTIYEDQKVDEIVKAEETSLSKEGLAKCTGVICSDDEAKDLDATATFQDLSSPSPLVAKPLQRTVQENKLNEGSSFSIVTKIQMEEQSGILETDDAECKVGEGIVPEFRNMNESQKDETIMLHVPKIIEEGYNPSQSKHKVIEEIGKKMEAMQHMNSDIVKSKDLDSKPKIKASKLECNIGKDGAASQINENVLSVESDLIKRLQFATEVTQSEEFTEVGETEKMPSLESALAKRFEIAHLLNVPEKTHAVASTKKVLHESEADLLPDIIAAVEIYHPQEFIHLENSDKVKDDNCKSYGEHANEGEIDLVFSEPDFSVISEGKGSDSLIGMITASQTLATEYPETDKSTSRYEDPLKGAQIKLKSRDIKEGQEYMLTESVSSIPSEVGDTKMVTLAVDVELLPSSDTGWISTVQNAKPCKDTEAKNFNFKEKFCDGVKEVLFNEPQSVEFSSTLVDKKQQPFKVDAREFKTESELHSLDTVDKSFCQISFSCDEQKGYMILPVVEKPLPEVSDVIMEAESDFDKKEYAESVESSVIEKPVTSGRQMLHTIHEDTASSNTELELSDLHNNSFAQENDRENTITVTENFRRILSNQNSTKKAYSYTSNRETGSNVKDASIPLNLQASDGLYQEMKVIKTEAFEDAHVQKSYAFKSVNSLIKGCQGLEKRTDEVVRDRRLECVLEAKPSQIFGGVTEIIKPSCELSSTEVDVRKRLEDEKDVAAVNDSENEMISKLDRVSEELKTVISSLEHSLVAGTGTDVRVTSILARLEQMEQEVVNLTSTSKACESSSPVLLPDVQTDYVVSTSQASPSTEQDLVHAEKIDLEDITYSKVKMPVGLGVDTSSPSLLHKQGPSGEINGQDVHEALTDVEDIFSDGDQSPLIKRKSLLVVSQQDLGAITDTEDMDLSGEEDDIIQEKKNLPTIQDLGLLPEPVKEVINLTEGYAREASPLLFSDSEPENEDVQGRHKKNMMKVDKLSQLDLPATDDVSEGLTDVEDIVASGDEEEAPAEIEDSLPDHYLDQSEGISDREKIKAIPPAPKIFLTKDDSSDDEKEGIKHRRHKSKESLKVEFHEGGTTDVEDLIMSDKGESKEKSESDRNESKEKIRRKKQVRRKTVPKKPVSKTLSTPVGDSSCLTDVETLTGDENQETLEDGSSGLTVPELDSGVLTDSEDLEVTDTEVLNLFAMPVDKIVPSYIPEPQREQIKISEVEEIAQEESGGETDEEGFELNEKDDEKPLMPRKKVVHEPLVTIIKETLDVDEPYEAAYTDTEDFDIDEKEEEEVMTDIASRIPKESDIYTITEMESHIGQITKREMIKDVHAELKQQIKDAELAGLTLQEVLTDSALTDVEDLEDSGEFGETEVKVISTEKSKSEEGLTDEESLCDSDIEDEIPEPPGQVKKQGKRLPLVPQVSEVRFVETEQGPLSIIITPDSFENNPNQILKDQVTNVVFLESEDKEEFATDIEDLSDGEEGKTATKLKASHNQEPATDTEDFDIDPSEVDRPLSPLPPNIKYDVLPSPKRELIQIKEDKYGVPQVTVRKLKKDELLVSDIEDMVVTDTEDIEVTEEEALRLVGVTEDSTSDFELPETGTTEVSTKMTHKKQSLHVEPEEDEGSTDVEELPLTRKPRRKTKSHSKLIFEVQGEDSHTDIELLSDQDDKGKLTVRVASPGGHTDMEDFETSEGEDLEVPNHEDAPTPDIIRDAAIRKMIILKEGPDGTTYTEDAHVAPARINLLGVEGESGAITDVEDIEVSGAEDDVIPDHPAVDLPEYEASSVDISEKTSIPSDSNEAKHVKDNLLLPEDNFNNLTDVESLGEGEGTHEADQLTEQQPQPLSHEQASSGHPTSVNKAGSDVVQPDSGAGAQQAPESSEGHK